MVQLGHEARIVRRSRRVDELLSRLLEKLEQTVALKFLPRALEGDPDRLERLYAEVRTARQVSHPAVCRVWDIGEAEGQHFLSMEFVDGENLASLLRRIGRFPHDKATDVARQIAEGLAAAHAKGLLHRDLKPANVMLDGQGKVHLTDFDLAGLALSLSAEDVRSGTPSYMSPEQLVGREVSVRSDIYALGLVIYELVTGRRAFEGKGFAELARRHRDERPVDPSALVPGLEPALERTILACLEKEPRKRRRRRWWWPRCSRAARLCLAAVVAGVLVPALQAPRHLLTRVPVEKSPAALEDRARELLARLGPTKPVDHAMGFAYDADYVRWAEERDRSKARWDSLATGEPPLVELWYRQSPRPLHATSVTGRVARNDPPIQLAGMAGARCDFRGRLLSFYVVPPQLERQSAASQPAASTAPDSAREPEWAQLFAEARLDPAQFRRVEPLWTPPFYADTRAAWEGHWPARPELALRVEAAAYRGRPVWFDAKNAWTRPEREQAFYILCMLLLAAVGGVLAYRNIRLGRGDRRGAFRLALGLTTLTTATWALRAHHLEDPGLEITSFVKGAGLALLVAALLWLFYLALEPYVRRLRPWTLVSWTRLLNGGTRDAVVGRDVLIGLTFGTCLALVSVLARVLVVWLGQPERAPEMFGLESLLSTRILFIVSGELTEAREVLWLMLPLAAVVWGSFVLLLLRFGLLAAITAVWTANMLLLPPLLYEPESWTGSATPVVLPLLKLLAVLAFRSASRGPSGLQRYLVGETPSSRPS